VKWTTEAEMTLDYNLLNHRFFQSKLPRLKVKYAKFSRQDSNVLGRTRFLGGRKHKGKYIKFAPYVIEINEKLRPALFARLNFATEVHEMVHVKLGQRVSCTLKNERPNPRFQKEIDRLMRLGCFRGVI